MSTSAAASITLARNVALNDGHTMPQLGYGLWQVPDDDASELVQTALAAGYRSLDTATIYENETGVGAGIRASGVARDEIFLTTKLWNSDHRRAVDAYQESLERLGLHKVDLYLIHWPSPAQGDYRAAWKALVDLQASGRVNSIGVSNFEVPHLNQIIADTGVVPAVNQVELHPYFQQRELREFHAQHAIATEAWSPLGQGGELLADPILVELARAHGASPAQIVLRWHLQEGLIVIPKSATPGRIRENASLDAITLSEADMDAIRSLDRAEGRIGPVPSLATF